MDKIQKLSWYVKWVSRDLMILMPLLLIGMWVGLDTPLIKGLIRDGIILEPVSTPEGIVNFSDVTWTAFSKITVFMAQLFGFLPVYLSLFF